MVVERKRTAIGWQVGFWVSAGLLLAFLLWLFSAVLFPFVMALVIGYLLDPLANKLEKMGVSRIWAVVILVVGSLVVVVLTLVFFTWPGWAASPTGCCRAARRCSTSSRC